MKKALIVFNLIFGFCLFSAAQFKEIGVGPSFPEPDYSLAKMVLLKNGNIIYINLNLKADIEVRLYNAQHKEIVLNYINPVYKDFKYIWVDAAFESAGDAVLLIGGETEKSTVMYRLIINGSDGRLKKEDLLAEINGVERNFVPFDTRTRAKADPQTGNYVVSVFSKPDAQKIWRVELITFSSNHQEIRRARSDFSPDEYEYVYFKELFINGSELAGLLVATKFSSNKKFKVLSFLASKKGETNLSFNQVFSEKDFLYNSAIISANPYTGKLLVIARTGDCCTGSMNSYYLSASLDPKKFSPENITKQETNTGLSSDVLKTFKYKGVMNSKYYFWGDPKSVRFNKDGSYRVIYEEDFLSLGLRTERGNVMVADYKSNAELVGNFLIPKKLLEEKKSSILYRGAFSSNYKGFFNTERAGNDYIFINDSKDNLEKIKEGKSSAIAANVSQTNALYYTVSGPNQIPEYKYVFDIPSDEKEKNVLAVELAVYDKENDVIIVPRLHLEGTNKTMSIIWLKPQ